MAALGCCRRAIVNETYVGLQSERLGPDLAPTLRPDCVDVHLAGQFACIEALDHIDGRSRIAGKRRQIVKCSGERDYETGHRRLNPV